MNIFVGECGLKMIMWVELRSKKIVFIVEILLVILVNNV